MPRSFARSALLFALLLGWSAAHAAPLPAGWFRTGTDPEGYEVGVADDAGRDGGRAAFIKGAKPQAGKFGTIMQTFAADDYRGRRVQLTALVKCEGVDQSCGLWLRIDGEKGMLRFDNTSDRRLTGTRDWTTQSIVLNVPAEAKDINFGLLLLGRGTAWLDGLTFTEVDDTVPLTSFMGEVSRQPRNLDFGN